MDKIGVGRNSVHGISVTLMRTMTLGLAGCFLGHMMFGLVDAITLGAKPGFLFWMLEGLIVSQFLLVRANKLVYW